MDHLPENVRDASNEVFAGWLRALLDQRGGPFVEAIMDQIPRILRCASNEEFAGFMREWKKEFFDKLRERDATSRRAHDDFFKKLEERNAKNRKEQEERNAKILKEQKEENARLRKEQEKRSAKILKKQEEEHLKLRKEQEERNAKILKEQKEENAKLRKEQEDENTKARKQLEEAFSLEKICNAVTTTVSESLRSTSIRDAPCEQLKSSEVRAIINEQISSISGSTRYTRSEEASAPSKRARPSNFDSVKPSPNDKQLNIQPSGASTTTTAGPSKRAATGSGRLPENRQYIRPDSTTSIVDDVAATSESLVPGSKHPESRLSSSLQCLEKSPHAGLFAESISHANVPATKIPNSVSFQPDQLISTLQTPVYWTTLTYELLSKQKSSVFVQIHSINNLYLFKPVTRERHSKAIAAMECDGGKKRMKNLSMNADLLRVCWSTAHITEGIRWHFDEKDSPDSVWMEGLWTDKTSECPKCQFDRKKGWSTMCFVWVTPDVIRVLPPKAGTITST